MTQESSFKPLFSLGEVVATTNATNCLSMEEIQAALRRHVQGDWGLIPPEDRDENELSLKEGFRLLSAYDSGDGTRFWIITEADRSVTTVLMPDDY